MDKEAKKQYMKEWRRNNKDRLRIYQERYWRRRIESEQQARAHQIEQEAEEQLRDEGKIA